MKKIFIVSVLFLASLTAKAQDSCYVYTQLGWIPTATKYVAKIQLHEEYEYFIDILDDNGEKLSFHNILHAFNYLSTKGWELVQLYPKNPDGSTSVRKQYALIRKKMSIEEAKQYSKPKEK